MKLFREHAIVDGTAVDPGSGSFTMPGVEPGQYTVCATTADNFGAARCATASVTVTEGETATVSLSLPN